MSTNDAPFTPEEPEWRASRTLADGTTVVLRPLGPGDKNGLREAFAHLSFETRYLRFFSAVTEPSESVLRYLTSVDQIDHVAIVATIESHDMKSERGAGIARFVRVAGEPEVAEAAVTVIDEMQRRGLGTVLLVELTRAALARGVRVFRGEVLATNEGMLQILESVGAELDPVSSAEVTAADVDPSRLARARDTALAHVRGEARAGRAAPRSGDRACLPRRRAIDGDPAPLDVPRRRDHAERRTAGERSRVTEPASRRRTRRLPAGATGRRPSKGTQRAKRAPSRVFPSIRRVRSPLRPRA